MLQFCISVIKLEIVYILFSLLYDFRNFEAHVVYLINTLQ